MKEFIIPLEAAPDIKWTSFDFIERATGPYWWAFVARNAAPLLIFFGFFIKPLRLNSIWLFFTLFLLSLSPWFEIFVIVITSIHRDFLTTSSSSQSVLEKLFAPIVLEKVFIGLLYASIIYFSLEFKLKIKSQQEVLDAE